MQALISKILKFVLIGVWILYPIVWVLSSGLNLLCASTEAILYGILDLLLKVQYEVMEVVVVYCRKMTIENSYKNSTWE
jgi:bacteriorhodopsin